METLSTRVEAQTALATLQELITNTADAATILKLGAAWHTLAQHYGYPPDMS